MQVTNKERQIHLCKQRKIQIKNNGIKAVFHGRNQNSSYPYLEIDYQYMYIVEEWLYNKIMVNIYNISNYRQVYILDKKCLYIVNNCIYITSHEIEDVLQDNCHYRLAKNNATIQLLSKALNNTDSVDNSILEFINNQNVTNIQSNLLFNSQPWMFQGLNQSQCKAMDLVIRQKIAFIKGPPGCGKTKTIARLALIFSYYSYPMLIGGVTNIANMTILNALLKECYIFNYLPNILLYISKQLSSQNALHTPQIRPFTFRYKIIQNYLILSQQNNMTRQSIEQLLDHFYSDGQMSSSFLSIYYQAMAKIFSQTQILIITTTSSVKMDIKLSNNQRFHPFIGILDEAAQASWADTYCYLVKGVHKMVFIGDDKQLTPTVISQNQILKETMFTKLFMKNPKYYILLNEQYRMHPKISQFPNIYFYQNQLKDGVSASERISQIPYFTTYPFSFINCNMEEMQVIDEHSGKKKYCNMGQIQIVKKILQYFPIEELSNIGIISPYDLQIKQICKQMGDWMLYYGLTVRTCDGYQGCEKDYIIVSCVRSNKFGKIGFCNEENRLNVTLTRARKGIIVIGNAQTFKNYSIPEITSQKQKNGQKDSQKQQEQQDQQKQQKYSQQQQKQKVQQKDKHVWKSYFEYLQQKQLILNVDKLQQYPISKNNYIHHYEQYIQNLNKQYEQLQTSEKQTNRQNSQQEQQKKQQQKIETVLIKNNIEDEEELENKIYKEYKKKIKYFMNQIRRIIKIQARLQQKQVQIANIRSQLYHTLSNTNYSIKKKEDKILIIQVSRIYNKIIYLTLTQYEKYQEFKTTSPSKSKKIEQNNFKGEDLLKQKTNQLTSKIIIQMQGQYNHYKENLLILQCIQINIIWSLEKYPCKQPQIIQQSKENIKKQKTQQKSSKK